MIGKLYLFFWINMIFLILETNSTSFSCNISDHKEQNIPNNICTIEEQVKVQSENDKLQADGIPSNISIDGLIAENKMIYYLPLSITNINYTFIKMLKITNSSLMEISKNVMAKLTVLEYLDLSGNNLATLNENLFQNNLNLSTILLNDNNIFLIHPSAFNGLLKLKILNLESNLCIDSSNTSSLIATTREVCRIYATYWNSTNEISSCRLRIASMIESALHLSTRTQNFQDFFDNHVKEVIRQCRNEFQRSVKTSLGKLVNKTDSTFNKIDELDTKIDQMIDSKEKSTLTSMMQNLTAEIGILRNNMTEILNKINGKVSENFNDTKELKKKFETIQILEENIADLNETLRKSLEDSTANLVSKNDFANRINNSDEFLSNLITQTFNSTKLMIESLDKSSEQPLIIFLIILNVILIILLIFAIIYITQLKKSSNNSNETTQEPPKYARISRNRTHSFLRTQNPSRLYSVSQPQPLYESSTFSPTENEALYAEHQNEDPIYEMEEFGYKSGQYDENVEGNKNNLDHLTYDTSHWSDSNEQAVFVSSSSLTEDNGVTGSNDEELYAEINVPTNANVDKNEQVDESQIYAIIHKP